MQPNHLIITSKISTIAFNSNNSNKILKVLAVVPKFKEAKVWVERFLGLPNVAAGS